MLVSEFRPYLSVAGDLIVRGCHWCLLIVAVQVTLRSIHTNKHICSIITIPQNITYYTQHMEAYTRYTSDMRRETVEYDRVFLTQCVPGQSNLHSSQTPPPHWMGPLEWENGGTTVWAYRNTGIGPTSGMVRICFLDQPLVVVILVCIGRDL